MGYHQKKGLAIFRESMPKEQKKIDENPACSKHNRLGNQNAPALAEALETGRVL
jgi:hypothetical protein